MKISDNADIITLLLGAPIEISIFSDNNSRYLELIINAPTLETIYCDTKFKTALGIFNLNKEKLQASFPMLKNVTLFNLLFFLDLKLNKDFTFLLESILYSFKKLGINIDIVNSENILIDNLPINEDIFNYLVNLILYLSKIKNEKNNPLEKDEKYQKAQDLINKIKSQGHKSDNNSTNFRKIFAGLVFQFGLDPLTIKNLNIFQYEEILKNYSNSLNQQITSIAAGNGLSKKVKTILQGGK